MSLELSHSKAVLHPIGPEARGREEVVAYNRSSNGWLELMMHPYTSESLVGLTIPATDFAELVKYWLTNSDLAPGDARREFMTWATNLRMVPGFSHNDGGGRLEQLPGFPGCSFTEKQARRIEELASQPLPPLAEPELSPMPESDSAIETELHNASPGDLLRIRAEVLDPYVHEKPLRIGTKIYAFGEHKDLVLVAIVESLPQDGLVDVQVVKEFEIPSDYGSWPKCHDCGRLYGDEHGFPDLIVPNHIWRRISPTGDSGGLLCPSCICGRLHAAGISNVAAAFMSGPLKSVDATLMETCAKLENMYERLEAREARERPLGPRPGEDYLAQFGIHPEAERMAAEIREAMEVEGTSARRVGKIDPQQVAEALGAEPAGQTNPKDFPHGTVWVGDSPALLDVLIAADGSDRGWLPQVTPVRPREDGKWEECRPEESPWRLPKAYR